MPTEQEFEKWFESVEPPATPLKESMYEAAGYNHAEHAKAKTGDIPASLSVNDNPVSNYTPPVDLDLMKSRSPRAAKKMENPDTARSFFEDADKMEEVEAIINKNLGIRPKSIEPLTEDQRDALADKLAGLQFKKYKEKIEKDVATPEMGYVVPEFSGMSDTQVLQSMRESSRRRIDMEEDFIKSDDKVGFFERFKEDFQKNPVLIVPFLSSLGPMISAYETLQMSKEQGKGTLDELGEIELFRRHRMHAAEAWRGQTTGGDVAGILSALPAFVGEIAMTGGIFTAVKTAMAKTGAAKLSEKTLERLITSSVKNPRLAKALMPAKEIISATAATVPQSLAAGPGRIATEAMERMTDTGIFETDQEGNVTFKVKPGTGEDVSVAIPKAVFNNWTEIASERTGVLVSGLTEPVEKFVMRWVRKNPSVASKAARDLLKRGQFHGVPAEMFEERLNSFLKAVGGTEAWGDIVPTRQQALAELISFTVPGATTGALSYLGPGIPEETVTDKQTASDIIDRLENTKTFKANPAIVSEAVTSDETPMDTTYVPTEDIEELYQEKTNDVIKEMGLEKEWADAKRLKAPMAVKTSKLMAKLAGSEHKQNFVDNLTFDANQQTETQKKKTSEAMKKLGEKLKDTPESVYDIVKTQLVTAGYSEEIADKQARIMDGLKAMLIREGRDPVEYFKKIGLNITSEFAGKGVDVPAKSVMIEKEETPEEVIARQAKELRTDKLTGLLNERAFEEDKADGNVVVAYDLAALKATNDKISKKAGNELLKAMARNLGSEGRKAYRKSGGGDEFAIRFKTRQEADEATSKIAEMLKNEIVVVRGIDTETGKEKGYWEIKGITFAMGVDENGSYDAADKRATEEKERRQSEGTYPKRGELPAGVRLLTDAESKRYLRGLGNAEARRSASSGVTVPEGALAQSKKALKISDAAVVVPAKVDKTDSPEFKKWFGKSKVVDSQGKPLVVYHGTPNSGFSVFETGGKGKTYRAGAFFSNSPLNAMTYSNTRDEAKVTGEDDYESSPGNYSVYLKIENPKIIDFEGKNWDSYSEFGSADEWFAEDKNGEIIEYFTNEEDAKFFRDTSDVKVKIRKSYNPELTQSTDDLARAARDEGYDGVIFKNITDEGRYGQGYGWGDTIYVAFSPTQIKSAIGNSGAFDPENPDILLQTRRSKDVLGYFVPKTREIHLTKNANLSTFLHETGHFAINVMQDLYKSGTASNTLRQDYETLCKAVGAKPGDTFSVDQHEKLARMFEAYLMEGKAPSNDLRRAFWTIRAWMLHVYKSVTNLGVTVSDEVRNVFDRMLASDAEIEEAQSENRHVALFTDPKMFPGNREQEEYLATMDDVRIKAEDELRAKEMDEISREWRSSYKKLRAGVASEVEAEFMQSRAYKTLATMKSDPATRINVPDSVKKGLPKDVTTDAEVDNEAIANGFGYDNAGEMLDDLMGLPELDEAVNRETSKRMKAIYGDFKYELNKGDHAKDALNNNNRAKLLRAELKHLQSEHLATYLKLGRKIAKPLPKDEFLESQAKEIINGMKPRDIQPTRYLAAQRRCALEAHRLLHEKGDVEGAFDQKQAELMNFYLYRAAQDALDTADTVKRYASGFLREEKRKKLGKTGYLDQIDNVLENVEFKNISLAERQKRVSFLTWYQQQVDEGTPPEVPDYLLDDAKMVNYRDMTVEDLRGLYDTLRSIEHFSTLKGKLMKAQKGREVEAVIDEMESDAKKTAWSKPIGTAEDTRNPMVQLAKNFLLDLTKLPTLLKMMGPSFEKTILQPANACSDKETDMMLTSTKELLDIYKIYTKSELVGIRHPRVIPGVKTKFSRMGAIMVALNCGTADNKQKLIDGFLSHKEPLINSESEIQLIIDSLDEKDWEFVKRVWKLAGSFYEESNELNKRVVGLPLNKIPGIPIRTARFGEIQGEYFHITYSRLHSPRAAQFDAEKAAKDALQGVRARQTTRHGQRMARVEGVKMVMQIDDGAIFNSIRDTIHDICFNEYLVDMNRLFQNKRFLATIQDNYGPEILKNIKDVILGQNSQVGSVATGEIRANGALDLAMEWMRSGSSIAAMGFSATTIMSQPLGMSQSIVRVGAMNFWRAVGKFINSPRGTIALVTGKSTMMKNRYTTMNPEIAQAVGKMNPSKLDYFTGGLFSKMRETMFIPMQAVQFGTVDVPTWLGSYTSALEKGKSEEDAVAQADMDVKASQASSDIQDLAAIQRRGPTWRLWLNFYSYFSTTLNLTQESWMKTQFSNPASVAHFVGDLVLLLWAPALLSDMMRVAITGGSPDDDEWWKGTPGRVANKALGSIAQYTLNSIPIVRDITNAAVSKYGYEGPAGARGISEIGKAWKVASKLAREGVITPSGMKQLARAVGTIAHLPMTQIIRTVQGLDYLQKNGVDAQSLRGLIGGVRR